MSTYLCPGLNITNFTFLVPSCGNCVPDPDADEVAVVFWSFQGPSDELMDYVQERARKSGTLVVENTDFHPSRLRDFKAEVVATELDLLNQIVDVVMEFDPDVIAGWEVQASSWGYLSIRGRQYG